MEKVSTVNQINREENQLVKEQNREPVIKEKIQETMRIAGAEAFCCFQLYFQGREIDMFEKIS